jgi:hypothetical protein
MPEISRFHGIVIRMYREAGEQHHRPHFHVRYHDFVARYGIDPTELLAGWLPRRQQRLIETWAQLHQRVLIACWTCLQAGRPPAGIEPIRRGE